MNPCKYVPEWKCVWYADNDQEWRDCPICHKIRREAVEIEQARQTLQYQIDSRQQSAEVQRIRAEIGRLQVERQLEKMKDA